MTWLWYVIPHHLVSRLTFRLTRVRLPLLVPAAIRLFVKIFKVNTDEAIDPDPLAYPTFNDFFTRALMPGARRIDPEPGSIVCPCDGHISQLGNIKGARIFQAKGHDYSLTALLGGSASRASVFEGGSFCTIYLSPRDYHRVHMPLAGELQEMVHVPGRLFGVNPSSVKAISQLFIRNERMAALFDTAHGPMAVIMVAAFNVAAIETVWSGLVTPPTRRKAQAWRYTAYDEPIFLRKGQEMARFNLGSTVIVLFSPGALLWDPELSQETTVKMGQRLGVSRA
jgi:phosphatidylserine decarboxylase